MTRFEEDGTDIDIDCRIIRIQFDPLLGHVNTHLLRDTGFVNVEISSFLRFQGAGAVMCAREFSLDIKADRVIEGQVLRYTGERYNSVLELYSPEIKPFYELLQSCASDIFIVPEYMTFLSDVTHRRNLGKCTILGTDIDGTLVSGLMTVSETSSAVILGAVATHPDFRRRGLSRELVRTLASQINARGREAYVFSAS